MLLLHLLLAGATSISGCVSDANGQLIPGVTVVAKAGPVERTTVASANGCYALTDVPPGTYRVTARLQGFTSRTRDRVVVAQDPVIHLDFVLSPSRICECITIVQPSTLKEAWQQADAVFRARVTGRDWRDPPPYFYRHAAEVLEVYKRNERDEPKGASVAVLEHQENNAPGPADSGQELVIFAHWVADERAFIGIGADCCGNEELAFLIDDGRVRAAPSGFSRFVGTSRESFIAAIRAFPRP